MKLQLSAACAATLLAALAPPSGAQGQPLSVDSRLSGLEVRELLAGATTAVNGTPQFTVHGPAGSPYLLGIEFPFLFDLVLPPPAGVVGPLCLFMGGLIPATALVDPAGNPPLAIPAGQSFQNLNVTIPITSNLIGLPFRYQGAVVPPGQTTFFLTNGQLRRVQAVPPNPSINNYFEGPNLLPVAVIPQSDVEQGDVDGDGDNDALAITPAGALQLVRNTGGAYVLGASLPLIPFSLPNTAEFADFDQDGFLDVATGWISTMLAGSSYLGIYQNQGGIPWGGYALVPQASLFLTGAQATTNDIETADINADGLVDVFSACGGLGGAGEQNRLFINISTPGVGIFFSEITIGSLPVMTDHSLDAEMGDVDLDGDVDIVVGNFDGPMAISGQDFVLINQGIASGIFALPAINPINPLAPVDDETSDVLLADIDGDGSLDIYIANARRTPTPAAGPMSVPDRLLLNSGTGTFLDVSILLPDNPSYPNPPTAALTSQARDAEAVDYNLDGQMDIVVALGGFGFAGSGPPTPGVNQGLAFVQNNLAGLGLFTNDPTVFLFNTMTLDVLDLEVGDWRLDGNALSGAWSDKDLGVVTNDGQFRFLGKLP